MILAFWGMCKLLKLNFHIHSMLTNMQHLLCLISIVISRMIYIYILLHACYSFAGFLITVYYGTCGCIVTFGFRMNNIMLSDIKLM